MSNNTFVMRKILILLLTIVVWSCQKEKQAYVFTYFDNSRQNAGLFVAYSYDGYNWTAVNDGEPIMKPLVGKEGIMRDPSVCQGPDGTFHLVWTVSWNAQSIGYASSKDLIHWSEQKIIPVMEHLPATRNTWAPELFYEASEDLFYIFWASTVPGHPDVSTKGSISEDQYNHRIYCTTTRDFETFSPTRLYFNPSFNVIDACVMRVPKTGELLMALKNENLNPPEKNIRLTRSPRMADGFPTEVSAPISGEEWAEGPTLIPIGDDILVYFDQFRKHKYGASLSHDGGYTWEDATDKISVPSGMSHGTAIAVPERYVKALSQHDFKADAASPRIVNIINFIRYTEPRNDEITEKVLYETVRSQAEDLRSKGLVGTYLLQYDALIDPSYQALMKEEMARGCEVGAWWEITQPHVEDAGYTWRGRYPWDWHANVGFSVGYTPAEREHLVDVYMERFKEIFGAYPKSVGSWFIEAGTLAYLADKYGIEASCNCRDQVGTDGYTLWGGYWNGAYYPSRENAYMPAQTVEGAINVPIFRMLGSDPLDQYEAGVGGVVQSVATMEPVYGNYGGQPEWIDWFFKMFTQEPHLGYNYVQIGQENSFTWKVFSEGFVYQTARLEESKTKGEVRIETLSETGRWFKEQYPVTPPTSVVASEDHQGKGRKTFWFNCRNYRVNLLWEGSDLKFRDMHLFDEQLRSPYLDAPDTQPVFHYETLPLVDGCLWSTPEHMAGLCFMTPEFQGGAPVFIPGDGKQKVKWPSTDGKGRFVLIFSEDRVEISAHGQVGEWCLQLNVNPGTELPFTEIAPKQVKAHYLGMNYGMKLEKGRFKEMGDLWSQETGNVLDILPEGHRITLVF